MEGLARALAQSQQLFNSAAELVASRLLPPAQSLWTKREALQTSSIQQLTPILWALTCARQLPLSVLTTVLSQCDSEQWASVGPVEVMQLHYACLKANLWQDPAMAGLMQRFQQLLPIMSVRSLNNLMISLRHARLADDPFTHQVWRVLRASIPLSNTHELMVLHQLSVHSHQLALQRTTKQQAMAQLSASLDAQSMQPLLTLMCGAAGYAPSTPSAEKAGYKRMRGLLKVFQPHQVVSLAMHLPLMGQNDGPLSDTILSEAQHLLPFCSLGCLARTLSGAQRLRGGSNATETYWSIERHITSLVAHGCSTHDLCHICTWMLEPDALFSRTLPVAVASCISESAPADIGCKLAGQLAQLVSKGVIDAEVMTPVLLQSLQHIETSVSARQMAELLSCLCDARIAFPQHHVEQLLNLMEDRLALDLTLWPLSLCIYNIFTTKRQTAASSSASFQSEHRLPSRCAHLSLPSTIHSLNTRPWLSEILDDPTRILTVKNRHQLCDVAQQCAQKYPELRSKLLAQLRVIAARQSQWATVFQIMAHHGCSQSEHPDLYAVIAAAPTCVQGERKRCIL